MQHAFHVVASRFAADHDLAQWLFAALDAVLEEAEVTRPVQDGEGETIWIDFGGDRYRVAATRDAPAQQPTWRVLVAHAEPTFVRSRNKRHQARLDALVGTIRTILLTPPDISLIAEHDD
mgnify:CR=1 FL=1